jgi:amidase
LRASIEPLLAKTGDRALETFLRSWWEIVQPPSLADFLSALQERDTILRRWQLFMERYPIVILPSCPHDRMLAGADAGGLEAAKHTFDILRFQLPIPVLGLPSLAVPVGTHQGMPQGVQIVSRRFREDLCFHAGRLIEAEEPSTTPLDPAF